MTQLHTKTNELESFGKAFWSFYERRFFLYMNKYGVSLESSQKESIVWVGLLKPNLNQRSTLSDIKKRAPIFNFLGPTCVYR